MKHSALGEERIEAVTLSEQVAVRLRNDILTGAIAPGAQIVVRDLVERLGVSHIPIREALRVLEAESLVISRPGQSVIASEVDLDEMHDLYRLRRVLEADVLRRGFEDYDEAFLARARALYDELLSLTPGPPDSGWWDAHRRYHWCFLEPGLTPWSTRLLQLLWQTAERYQRLYVLVFASADAANVEHNRILQAAAGGDIDTLIDAWLQHLTRTEKSIASGYVARHGEDSQTE